MIPSKQLLKILCLLIIFTLLFLLSCKDSDNGNTPVSNNSDTSNNSETLSNPDDANIDVPVENPLYIDDLPDEKVYGIK